MERGDVVLAVGLPGLALSAAGLAGSRALMRRRLADRLRAADAAVRAGVERAASDERRRIAAEVQALVHHDVERIGAEVAAARRAAGNRDRAALAGALAAVNRTAAETLQELGRLLEAVSPAAAETPARAPGLPVDGLAALGPGVEVIERGDARLTPPGSRFVAGRLARDVLTPAVPARVRLVHRPGQLELRVAGRGPRPATLADPGALVALREGARLHGGSLTAASGVWGWRVRACLPTDAASVTRRLPWSPEAVDALLAASVTALVIVDVTTLPVRRPVLGVAFGVATTALPLAFRRRAPLAVSVVAAAGMLGGAAAGALPAGPAVPYFEVTLLPFAAAAHAPSAGRALAGVGITTAAAVLAAVPQLGGERWPRPRDLSLLGAYGVLMGALTWFARHHHVRALALAIDQEELADRHPALVDAAVAGERRRVARDLHDMVSHGVTLCGVLAGGAAARLRTEAPGQLSGTIGDLERAVAQTRVELARLVAALELPVTEAGPSRRLDELAALVRDAGPQVTLDPAPPEPGTLPARVQDAAYRVVQEALTNARRHAGSPVTRVAVRVAGDDLRVEVMSGPPRDAPAGPGTGRGLSGMRARVTALGGEAEAGPLPDGGFRVMARLPRLPDAG